jgi:hypothetical protein
MGADFYSYTFFGVDVEDLLTRKTKIKRVKKFNENTGKPYFKEFAEETFFLAGKPIPDDVDVDSTYELGEFMKEKYDLKTESGTDDSPTLLGLPLCGSTGSNGDDSVQSASEKEVLDIISDVRTKLRKIDKKLEPRLFNILYCSY